ncbi:hypothetical protein NHX12_026104 [Muraenolepis orangiensis]|uniref:Uncharacterized protein n=1 Tax=Muraenolepis orangiensis TaxID=630683 RepID=A0A9Q0IQF5_9TELE|nr:hypothetical protein NHX12_026104 [Muraenolepis orangiensis]
MGQNKTGRRGRRRHRDRTGWDRTRQADGAEEDIGTGRDGTEQDRWDGRTWKKMDRTDGTAEDGRRRRTAQKKTDIGGTERDPKEDGLKRSVSDTRRLGNREDGGSSRHPVGV